jgi:hypothetical protein
MLKSFITFLFFYSVAVTSFAEEVRYTGAAFRDPFGGQARPNPADNNNARLDQQIKSMTIQGLLLAGKNSRAIIDGRIYRIGSVLGAGRVTRIDQDGVTITINGKETIIKPKIRKTRYADAKTN